MASKRSDVHAPSVIVPTDYEFVCFLSLRELSRSMFGYDFVHAERIKLNDFMDKTGAKFSKHEHGGSCHICGAHAIDLGVFFHVPSGELIKTGGQCMEKLCDAADMRRLDAFRKDAKRAETAIAGKRKAEKTLLDKGIPELTKAWEMYVKLTSPVEISAAEAMAQKDPWATPSPGASLSYEEVTILDIIGKLIRYGSISDAQERFLIGLVNKHVQKDIKKAEWAARDAERAKISEWVGAEKQKVELEVTVEWVKDFESSFGYYGSVFYMAGCVDSKGNVIIHKGSEPIGKRGEKLRIKGTIKKLDVRNGIKQTMINRVKVLDVLNAVAA